jgi:hypothetical protein
LGPLPNAYALTVIGPPFRHHADTKNHPHQRQILEDSKDASLVTSFFSLALIKERLVIQDKWITIARFQRVFSVHQILPGPEAAELCMFFGCLSAGRIGGIVAGIAFILPGFTLMLLASYLYLLAGFENIYSMRRSKLSSLLSRQWYGFSLLIH